MAESEAASSSTTKSTAFSSLIVSLLETIGVEIFTYYLHPKDLLSLGLTSRQLHNTLLQPNALIACIHHCLPLQLGVTTNYLAELIDSHSYNSKSQLVDHLLDKLHTSNLRLECTTSLQESQHNARLVFLTQGKSNALFYSTTTNCNENDNTSRIISTTAAVECHYQVNATKSNAVAWMNYILNRDACQRYGKDGIHNRLIRDWLMILLSSIHLSDGNDDDDTTIQIWRWGCKHPNLSGSGISGVGVMISSPHSEVGRHPTAHRLEIELRLTRLY